VQAAFERGESREASQPVWMVGNTTAGTQVDTRWGSEPLACTLPPIGTGCPSTLPLERRAASFEVPVEGGDGVEECLEPASEVAVDEAVAGGVAQAGARGKGRFVHIGPGTVVVAILVHTTRRSGMPIADPTQLLAARAAPSMRSGDRPGT
jgi:hypothetical protein